MLVFNEKVIHVKANIATIFAITKIKLLKSLLVRAPWM